MHKPPVSLPGTSLSRQISLKTVFRTIVENGAISRAELARRTGLSKQTTSEIVRELIQDGWLQPVGHTQGKKGRSALNYDVNGKRGHVLAADLGGTSLTVAVADLSGAIIDERQVATDPRGGHHVVDQVSQTCRDLLVAAGIERQTVVCGAIGVPGAYDAVSDRLRLASNIANLGDIPMAQSLSAGLGVPVFVENDVTNAAKGELWRGRGQNLDTFVFLAIGTGIGLGIVSGRRIVRGARGAAGEIAFLPIGGDPFDSRHFHNGALESVIGSTALMQRYRASGGSGAETVAELFELLAQGDHHATMLLDEMGRSLAVALSAVCAIVDPELIITGGSIGARKELVDRIRTALPQCTPAPVDLEISDLGAQASILGAVSTALDQVHALLFDD